MTSPLLRASVAATTVGIVAIVVGSFLPWVRTGRRRRSSFDLVGVADRLGVVPSGLATPLVRGWVVVPLVGAGVVALLVVGAHRAAGVLAVVAGLYTLALAWFVVASPLATESGLPTTAAGGVMALGGGIVLGSAGWTGRRRKAGAG